MNSIKFMQTQISVCRILKTLVTPSRILSHSGRHMCTQAVLCKPSHIQALAYSHNLAITDCNGQFTYQKLSQESWKLACKLSNCNTQSVYGSLHGQRIAFLADNRATIAVFLWATWITGAIAVPLCKSHPQEELNYVLNDCQVNVLLGLYEQKGRLDNLKSSHDMKLLLDEDRLSSSDCDKAAQDDNQIKHVPDFSSCDKALIIYTSGTTGRPKGVVLTHANLISSMNSMIEAWKWTSSDVCLHCLPLHHVHGLINALLTPLYVGAQCVMLEKFDAQTVWRMLLDKQVGVTIFHAVPTMYAKLLEYANNSISSDVTLACRRIRLMVSGSSALPASLMNNWFTLSGHKLLERYGMTEIQMALTNPLNGERRQGSVGQPFPRVEAHIANTGTQMEEGESEDGSGELHVKSESVFTEYWNRPEATREAFTSDGWFRTGDLAVLREGYYHILGRLSVDIIKSGGYKISALEIESKLLLHDDILECAVLGRDDDVWGETVAAVVSLKEGSALDLTALRNWCLPRMPHYHIPSSLVCLTHSIPRNAMGKVNKKHLRSTLFSTQQDE